MTLVHILIYLVSITIAFMIWSICARFYVYSKVENDKGLPNLIAKNIGAFLPLSILIFLSFQSYIHIVYNLSADIFIYGLLSLIIVGIAHDR